MSTRRNALIPVLVVIAAGWTAPARAVDGGWTLVGWNDLGMHCMDADYTVFSILPPYNTIHAQLMDPSGQPVGADGGVTVTYQAVADAAGSITTTSLGRTDFWQSVQALFGVQLAPDQGLAGYDMPGPANGTHAMAFDPARAWFTAEGIPITPTDDDHATNYYPMMRLTARNGTGQMLATTDIVLPVSDEMTCRSCHASGTGPAARPAAGWAYDPDPERDYRLNVLLLHDQLQDGQASWTAALAAAGYDQSGLYATTTDGATPVLCARCHGSNALPGTGVVGVTPLTRAMHGGHAPVVDPGSGLPLDAASNRTACYTCHPGSDTRCLRGAMGNAAAADGTLAIQCQGCHGGMSRVGAAGRQGWFEQPTCQSCHTGTATHNNGQIRYATAFNANGSERQAVDATFATNPDTPASGLSLYRFSSGHGGLQCEACHGSTHAIFPSREANDNVQSEAVQGHAGTLVECQACHAVVPATVDGGPHGMHPVGQAWVEDHQDAAEEGGTAACATCHGADLRGTVLSRSHADRTVSAFGPRTFWRGAQIGCYSCHAGPDSDHPTGNHAPVAHAATAATDEGVARAIALVATDADGNALTLRVVSQPSHGSAGIAGTLATYRPDRGFVGTDTFTWAAWDGATDSNLAMVTVTVSSSGVIFVDGFESDGLGGWSASTP